MGGAALLLRNEPANKIADRLDLLTGAATPTAAKNASGKEGSILSQPLDDKPGFIDVVRRAVRQHRPAVRTSRHQSDH